MQRKVVTIGAATGWGASIRACEEGPSAVASRIEQMIKSDKTHYEIDIAPCEALSFVAPFNRILATKVWEALSQHRFPLIIGGDHSIAVGTWNGVLKAHREQGGDTLGLLWIDAHMDSHTPETTPSGAFHGMGLAALLGKGPEEFTHIFFNQAVLKPDNVYLIGPRSFEPEEHELLKELGVHIIYAEEVEERGLKEVVEEALEDLCKECSGIGVSLDLDVIDPKEAPGVGSPEPGGVSFNAVKESLALMKRCSKLLAFEVVEYSPQADKLGKTKKILEEIIDIWTKSP